MIPLFSIVLGFLAVTVPPQARSACNEGCLTNNNTVLGDDALFSLTSGTQNTAIGYQALRSATTSLYNTALGYKALASDTTGGGNTALGTLALNNNTIGISNTASGYQALNSNITGNFNTAHGQYALYSNTIGDNNIAIGLSALSGNTTGNDNTAVGVNALIHTSGNNNIALGSKAGLQVTGDNNIDIGHGGRASDSGVIRLGKPGEQTNTYIAGISGVTVAGGVGVIVDTNGKLGTVVSSQRFKDAVKPMDKSSEAILALKPVTFRYKHELDPDGIPQFGLVAEDVEKVNPDLVARDEQGKPYTVRYDAVNAMLLNEFLKEHRRNEEQAGTIAQLKAELQATATRQQKQIEALTAGLQKVNAQLEVSKLAPQMALSAQ